MKLATTLTTFFGATALCVATPSAADPCPSSTTCISHAGCDSTTEASGGMARDFDSGIHAEARFDLSRLECAAESRHPFFSEPVKATVTARDDLVVTGVLPGTPLTISARIEVWAYVTWPGVYAPLTYAGGWMEVAGAGRLEAIAIATEADREVHIDEIRWLVFPNLAGTPFRLSMGAESQSSEGYGTVLVGVAFAGLPPGAQVQSCHAGPPVPARPASWGSLKLRYR